MSTLVDLAAELRDMEIATARPSILSMFDSVFRPEVVAPAEPKEKEEG